MLKPPNNVNYAATIVAVPEPVTVPGLDNLVAVPMFGYQALTTKGIQRGDLRVLFTAETQVSVEFARENDLHRDHLLNKTEGATGYLETNRRVKALRLRKNQSNALLMPVDSLAYTGYPVGDLKAGDTFDQLNGHDICQKYEVRQKAPRDQKTGPKIRQRVDQKLFPQHLDTEHLFRNLGVFRNPQHIVVTQKLHGTSWRGGRVPVARDKGRFERLLNRVGVKTPDTQYEDVFGSRRVVKGQADNNHFYDTDLWTSFGKTLAGRIPEGFMVYGELIGWVDENTPIQKGYTYNLLPGNHELYVYRVATVNGQGVIADLSWNGVKDFCRSLGLKWTPEVNFYVEQGGEELTDIYRATYLDKVLSKYYGGLLPLSDPKTVDEGICVRIEGQVPRIYKAKSPIFLEHETKQLDAEVVDIEVNN